MSDGRNAILSGVLNKLASQPKNTDFQKEDISENEQAGDFSGVSSSSSSSCSEIGSENEEASDLPETEDENIKEDAELAADVSIIQQALVDSAQSEDAATLDNDDTEKSTDDCEMGANSTADTTEFLNSDDVNSDFVPENSEFVCENAMIDSEMVTENKPENAKVQTGNDFQIQNGVVPNGGTADDSESEEEDLKLLTTNFNENEQSVDEVNNLTLQLSAMCAQSAEHFLFKNVSSQPFEPCPGLHFPGKPENLEVRIPARLHERRRHSILRPRDLYSVRELALVPGERVLVVGSPGSGKTYLHRSWAAECAGGAMVAVDLVVLFVSAEDLAEVFSVDQLRTVCGVTDYPAWCWMLQHPQQVVLLVDSSVDEANPGEGYLSQLLTRVSLPKMAVVLLARDSPVLEGAEFDRVFDLCVWTDEDTLVYLRQFAASALDSEEVRTDFLELFEGMEVSRSVMRTAQHCATLALLYCLQRDTLAARPPRHASDILHLLFVIGVNGRSYPEVLQLCEDAWTQLKLGHSQTEFRFQELSLMNSEFQVFLAAKYVVLRYFSAVHVEQMGSRVELLNVFELFEMCWDLNKPDYNLQRISVHIACLLGQHHEAFLNALAAKMAAGYTALGRRRCLSLCDDILSMNLHLPSMMSKLESSLGDAAASLERTTDGAASMNSLLFRSSIHLSSAQSCAELEALDVDVVTELTDALQHSDRLKCLELDLTTLEPGAHVLQVVTGLSANTALRQVHLRLRLEEMSEGCVRAVTHLLETALTQVEELQLSLLCNSPSAELADCSVSPLSRRLQELCLALNSFLLRTTSSLKLLGLHGSFLFRTALPTLRIALLRHQALQTLRISGQTDMATYCCPLAVSVLGDVLRRRSLLSLDLDVLGFRPLSGNFPVKLENHSAQDYVSGAPFSQAYATYYGMKQVHLHSATSSPVVSPRSPRPRVTQEAVEIVQLPDKDALLSELFSAMSESESLRCVRLRCAGLSPTALPLFAEFVADCVTLQELHLDCGSEQVPEELLLCLSSALVCALRLQKVSLTGSFQTSVEHARGGMLYPVLQSACVSMSLQQLLITGQPISAKEVEWLTEPLDDLLSPPRHPLKVNIHGYLVSGEAAIVDLHNNHLPANLNLKFELNDHGYKS